MLYKGSKITWLGLGIVFSVSLAIVLGLYQKKPLELPLPSSIEEENVVGGAVIEKILKPAPNTIQVKSEIKNRQVILENVRTKYLNSQPLTTSFDVNEITETDDLNSLISEFVERCGQLTAKDYSGKWPPLFEDVLGILEKSC